MHTSQHPQSLHHPHAGMAAGTRPLIEFSDFCFAYGDTPTLSHIDLAIDAGESVVLMGDNGSGKSTLLKALSGLVLPQRGTYRFDGQVVDADSMRDSVFSKRLHQRVGVIFQDSLRMFAIGHLRGRAPYNLSGGEQKKVAIACILSMNPDVYCFDEPLNGLDRKTRAWLVGFLKQLKAAGKTLVVATHDQSLADEVADWFAYMGDYHGYEDRPHVHIGV